MGRWQHILEIVPALESHVDPIAENIRAEDRNGVMASSGSSPAQSIRRSMEQSLSSWTVMADYEPVGMFGVGDFHALCGTLSDTRVGAAWLMGAVDLSCCARSLLPLSVLWRDQLLGDFSSLIGAVDERHTAMIRWLLWLGFSISDPVPVGENATPFRIFQIRRGADV